MTLAVIAIKKVGCSIVGHIEVRTSIVVEVAPNHAHAVIPIGIIHAGLFRDLSKGAVAVVVIESIACAFQSTRAALHLQVEKRTCGSIRQFLQIFQMAVHVVTDKQVNESVAIVIGKRRSRGPSAIAYAGLFGNVGEGTVSVVAIQHVASQASDINIGPAIVVIIAHRSAHRPAGIAHAGFLRHIGEGSIMIVVIKSAARLLSSQGHVNRGRIREINIQPAVAVIVEQQDSTGHDDVFVLCRTRMLEGDAGARGDISEVNR